MKSLQIRGTYTALVTPFKSDNSIDFNAFKQLIDFQIKNGVEGIVVCGSTGESATLSAQEKLSLIITAVDHAKGKTQIIAGTGSNSTGDTIALTLLAKEHGADAALIVAPYYNKPTQEGLYHHYKTIANSVDIPIIIYNVPGRAAVNIQAEVQLRLAEECKNIVATKEASGNIDQIMQIIKNAPKGFSVLSGDDSYTVPMITMGAVGTIAVISNYAPKMYSDMVRYALKGETKKAVDIHFKLFDLMMLNFVESNPIPVKAALTIMKKIKDVYRLPLVKIHVDNKKKIEKALTEAGII